MPKYWLIVLLYSSLISPSSLSSSVPRTYKTLLHLKNKRKSKVKIDDLIRNIIRLKRKSVNFCYCYRNRNLFWTFWPDLYFSLFLFFFIITYLDLNLHANNLIKLTWQVLLPMILCNFHQCIPPFWPTADSCKHQPTLKILCIRVPIWALP